MSGSESLSDLLSLPPGGGGGPPGDRIAGRYVIGERIGMGASGAVYRAHDAFTDRDVALKLLSVLTTRQRDRLVREVGALRVLRVPGVVRLLDEGEVEGRSFIVMSLVAGEPFPGAGADGSWESVRPTVLALLETLARVHAAGIIHRDLKPGNLLVDAEGQPTLLDFGLARGADQTITAAGTVVGTPRYLAPEQVHGRKVDARTDLYALGVMLYEYLAGVPPHEGLTTAELLYAKDLRPRPLGRRARDTPDAVAQVVDRLLEPDSRLRFRSAVDVMTALEADPAGLPHGSRLPWLGDRAPVEALVQAALNRTSLDVAGPAGSGRTRVLEEVETRLGGLALKVAWTRPARRPLESLESLWETTGLQLGTHVTASPEGVLADATQRLETLSAAGWVILVDDWERVDRWSARVLAGCRAQAVILGSQLGPDPEAVALEPLGLDELRPLFAGPDRLLHLREDGARELLGRTGGLQARVAAELQAWVHRGMAAWEEDRLRLDRKALERSQMGLGQQQVRHHGDEPPELDEVLQDLLAWVTLAWPHGASELLHVASGRPRWQLELELQELVAAGAVARLEDGRVQPLHPATALQDWLGRKRRDAHLAVAVALEPGAEGRLVHLIAAGSTRRVGQEAEALAERLLTEGRLGHATAVLDEALFIVRRGGGEELLGRLLALRGLVALLGQNTRGLRAAILALRRDREGLEEARNLTRLLGAALAFLRGRLSRAGELLSETRPLRDPRLDAYSQTLRFHLDARSGDLEGGLDRLRQALRDNPHPFAQARLASTEGWAAYWAQDFPLAAEHFERSAELAWARSSKLLGLTKSASALMECGRLDEAEALALEAVELAARHRLPVAEGRSEWVLRTVHYRQCKPLEPDEELVRAAGLLETDHLLGMLALGEAAAAWRLGRADLARELGAVSREAFAREGAPWSLLAEALERLCGGDPPGTLDELVDRSETVAAPLPRIQVLALAARVEPARSDLLRRVVELAEALPPADRALRREVLSVEECVEGWVGRDAG